MLGSLIAYLSALGTEITGLGSVDNPQRTVGYLNLHLDPYFCWMLGSECVKGIGKSLSLRNVNAKGSSPAFRVQFFLAEHDAWCQKRVSVSVPIVAL